ncbi:MAG: DoxX family protein [Planctomycetota bacterium]|nr:MAG: DoxX family protein [Planctomycetota bacterium]
MTTNERKDWGITVLRVAVGGIFVAHGVQKLAVFGISGLAGFMSQLGIPFPTLSAVAVTAAELGGGLALVAGLFTRWAALPLAFSMAVAAVTVHLKGGFFLPDGVEYVLTLFLASIALVLTGSGSFSIDRLLEKRAQEKSPVGAERPYPAAVEVR